MKLGIFDSGVGGLTVFSAVQGRLPNLPITYFCDNAGFPYGPKSDEEVLAAVATVLPKFLACHPVSHLVIACNTASTLVLPLVREKFKIPVIGVVPAIKPAAKVSKTKVIGLLATPGTVKRRYTEELISQFASECEVVRVGSSRLVLFAEQKLRGEKVSLEDLRSEVSPLFARNDLDTVVLGCTHFPLLRSELEAIAPRTIQWLDSGEAIASRVDQIFAEEKITLSSDPADFEAVFSRLSPDVERLRPSLHAWGIHRVSMPSVDQK